MFKNKKPHWSHTYPSHYLHISGLGVTWPHPLSGWIMCSWLCLAAFIKKTSKKPSNASGLIVKNQNYQVSQDYKIMMHQVHSHGTNDDSLWEVQPWTCDHRNRPGLQTAEGLGRSQTTGAARRLLASLLSFSTRTCGESRGSRLYFIQLAFLLPLNNFSWELSMEMNKLLQFTKLERKPDKNNNNSRQLNIGTWTFF